LKTRISCFVIALQNPGGIPLDILALDFWVPGCVSQAESPKYVGKSIFKEILKTTNDTCMAYIRRVTQDGKHVWDLVMFDSFNGGCKTFKPIPCRISKERHQKTPPTR